jgi:hypothetical protein
MTDFARHVQFAFAGVRARASGSVAVEKPGRLYGQSVKDTVRPSAALATRANERKCLKQRTLEVAGRDGIGPPSYWNQLEPASVHQWGCESRQADCSFASLASVEELRVPPQTADQLVRGRRRGTAVRTSWRRSLHLRAKVNREDPA